MFCMSFCFLRFFYHTSLLEQCFVFVSQSFDLARIRASFLKLTELLLEDYINTDITVTNVLFKDLGMLRLHICRQHHRK